MAPGVGGRSGAGRVGDPSIARVCAADGRRVLLGTRSRVSILPRCLVPKRPALGIGRPGEHPLVPGRPCASTRRVRTPRGGAVGGCVLVVTSALGPVLKTVLGAGGAARANVVGPSAGRPVGPPPLRAGKRVAQAGRVAEHGFRPLDPARPGPARAAAPLVLAQTFGVPPGPVPAAGVAGVPLPLLVVRRVNVA